MKLKGLKLKETANGWHVTLYREDETTEYVYPADRLLFMIAEIGKFIFGTKVKVEQV